MPKNTILVSMDVTSLYTNTTHEEGVTTVCHVYEKFYRNALSYFFILTENSFQLCGSNYLQTHGIAMGTKMAVAFANIFMVRLENQRCNQLVFWKRYFFRDLNTCSFIEGYHNMPIWRAPSLSKTHPTWTEKSFPSWQNCRQGIENQTRLDVRMLS